MKCMLCGTENKAEARNCKGCGALLAPRETSISGRKVAPTIVDPIPSAGGSGSKTRVVSPDEFDQIQNSNQQTTAESKKTRYVAPGNSPIAPVHGSSAVAPLAGFLVSFSWDTTGLWFPVREGRTVVGTDSACDAVIKQDRAMSGKHFAIMVRKGAIRIRDLETTNATSVDGKEVWSDSLAGFHGTKIKAGDTEFTLVMIPTGRSSSHGESESEDEDVE